jgi:hypothetical protein
LQKEPVHKFNHEKIQQVGIQKSYWMITSKYFFDHKFHRKSHTYQVQEDEQDKNCYKKAPHEITG